MKAKKQEFPGRPPKYPGRKRTTVMLSPDLLEKIELYRGRKSRNEFIEDALQHEVKQIEIITSQKF